MRLKFNDIYSVECFRHLGFYQQLDNSVASFTDKSQKKQTSN